MGLVISALMVALAVVFLVGGGGPLRVAIKDYSSLSYSRPLAPGGGPGPAGGDGGP